MSEFNYVSILLEDSLSSRVPSRNELEMTSIAIGLAQVVVYSIIPSLCLLT
jgi:hypothetical protein